MKKSLKNFLKIASVTAILIISILIIKSFYIKIGSSYHHRNELEISVSAFDSDIFSSLLKLDYPSKLDLSGCSVSFEQYEILSARYPDCDIMWDIPLTSGSYSCDSDKIDVPDLSDDDINKLSYFNKLNTINISGSSFSEDKFQAVKQAFPECNIFWNVPIFGSLYPSDIAEICVDGTAFSADEFNEMKGYFSNLLSVNVSNSSLSVSEQLDLINANPDIDFIWNVSLQSENYLNSVSSLSFSNADETLINDIIEAAPLFKNLTTVDLGDAIYPLEYIKGISDGCNNADIICYFNFCDKKINTQDSEIDISNNKNINIDVFDEIVSIMPNLEKIVMCDCGLTDEEMDALNHKYNGVRFVWTVHLTRYYTLRTDATAFCGSNRPDADYVAVCLTDEEIYPLRYCTDMVALDLGHMLFTDLSFLGDMKHLKYLVIACDYGITDISVVTELPELEFLEIFNDYNIQDISCLSECKNLHYLNAGCCNVEGKSALSEMKWLKYLWVPYIFTDEEAGLIRDALPDTVCCFYCNDGSTTGDGWKETDAYHNMRDMYGMFYN